MTQAQTKLRDDFDGSSQPNAGNWSRRSPQGLDGYMRASGGAVSSVCNRMFMCRRRICIGLIP
jgi:hypothetical protein